MEARGPGIALPTGSESDQRRLLEAIFVNASVALFVMDQNQHCAFMNAAAEQLTGYTLDETRGRPLHDVVHHTRPNGTHYPIEECPIDRAFPERMQVQGEDVFVHKTGAFYPVAYTASPLKEGERTVGTIIEVRALAREQQAEAAAVAAARRAQDLFDRVSDSIVVVDEAFRVVEINRTAMGIDGRTRQEILGRPMWELWPGWNGTAAQARMLEAARTRLPFETEHYYRMPPLDLWLEARGFPTAAGGMAIFFRDITARRLAEQERGRAEALLRAVGEASPDLIYVKDRESRVLYANPPVLAVIGLPASEVFGRNEADWHHDPAEAEAVLAADRRVMESGTAEAMEEVFTTPGRRMRVFASTKAPRRDAEGRVIGLVGISRDVTERREAERQRELMVNELNHRVKNTLAVVQGIAGQTLRGRCEPEALHSFDARLRALADAHDLLTERGWLAAALRDIVQRAVLVHGGERAGRIAVESEGEADLAPKMAVALAMALHELATNAVKHGALSVQGGGVQLRWQVAAGVIRIDWRESGGPPVQAAPTRHGFGMRLLERSITEDLGGQLQIDFLPAGLNCSLQIPLDFGPNG